MSCHTVAILTMAAWLEAVAVTADRRWKEVVNDQTIRIELIR